MSENCVLFLEEYRPGRSKVVGGPTGRFEAEGGIIGSPSLGTATKGEAILDSLSTSAVGHLAVLGGR